MATETSSCDYLVVGAGASGMSFVDTLLLHAPEPVSVTLLDKREQPGGHWNDAYDYVTLHQPARNYGVESTALEAFTQHPEKLASRDEILDYYRSLLSRWGEAGHRVSFVGGAAYDFGSASYVDASGSRVGVDASKVVDARYTENDLPLLVPPKFSVGDGVDLIPPNQLPARGAGEGRRYCVLGGGKTGQDAVLFLRQTLGVPLDRIAWVVPHLPWITARDPPSPLRQNTCIEFIASALEAHAAAGSPPSALSSSAFLQSAFAKLEEEGKVYRLLPGEAPTKFMDATLNRREAELLRESAPSVIRGRGRVASLSSTGDLVFADGSELALPWANEGGRSAAELTTYVHCTAGAFNFGASAAEGRRPVFSSEGEITVQELFQFPGFCFNGAVVAWLECQRGLSLAQKNALCELPPPPEEGEAPPLGPVAGQVGPLSAGHPLLVSLRNLRRWYATPGMGEWLHGLRLFSLAMNGYSLAEGRALVEKNCDGLVEAGLLTPPEEGR